ncbi:hypothetical protein, partial [Propionibacterium acidifaciens]|uniref:hypothetical protein n=1 Tax=Propionibacterium acidifaciens TaxID=556499 RepID=UPI0005B8329A
RGVEVLDARVEADRVLPDAEALSDGRMDVPAQPRAANDFRAEPAGAVAADARPLPPAGGLTRDPGPESCTRRRPGTLGGVPRIDFSTL